MTRRTEAGRATDGGKRVRHRDPRIRQLRVLAQTEDLDVLPQLLQRECEVASDDEQVVDGRTVAAGDDLDAEDVDVMGGEAARDERQAAGLVGQRQPDELWLLALDRVLEHLSASPLGVRPHDTGRAHRDEPSRGDAAVRPPPASAPADSSRLARPAAEREARITRMSDYGVDKGRRYLGYPPPPVSSPRRPRPPPRSSLFKTGFDGTTGWSTQGRRVPALCPSAPCRSSRHVRIRMSPFTSHEPEARQVGARAARLVGCLVPEPDQGSTDPSTRWPLHVEELEPAVAPGRDGRIRALRDHAADLRAVPSS